MILQSSGNWMDLCRKTYRRSPTDFVLEYVRNSRDEDNIVYGETGMPRSIAPGMHHFTANLVMCVLHKREKRTFLLDT